MAIDEAVLLLVSAQVRVATHAEEQDVIPHAAALDAIPDETREQVVIPGEAPVPDAIPPLSPVQDVIPSAEPDATHAEEQRALRVRAVTRSEALAETLHDSEVRVSIPSSVATRSEAVLLHAIRCEAVQSYAAPVAMA